MLLGEQHPVEHIASRLHDLLRVGVRPAKLVPYLDLLTLLDDETTTSVDPYARAVELAGRLTEAVQRLGDGAVGRAAQALFGVTQETRGRLLKDRRRIAADELDLMPSTFRKYYEDDLVLDVAVEMWRGGGEAA